MLRCTDPNNCVTENKKAIMINPIESADSETNTQEPGGTLDSNVTWRSCCLTMDKQFVMFLVQTLMGAGLLAFSAFRLTTETDCDRNAPYWGLIGTICGFFFRKVSKASPKNTK